MRNLREIVTAFLTEHMETELPPEPFSKEDVFAAASSAMDMVEALPRIADALERIAEHLNNIEMNTRQSK